ncbi:hypothetical protein Lser_V15G35198 [Lactuca serriola]
MGNTGEDAEASPMMMEKKKKKSKNITNNHPEEIDNALPKEKPHKHKNKKRKSESNEDGGDKAIQEDNGDLQKKRKKDSSKSALIKENNQSQDDDPIPKKEKKKKKKSKANEDGYNGNLEEDNSDLQKKHKKKKRKRDSSEKTQTNDDPKPKKEKKKNRKSKSNEDGDKGNLEQQNEDPKKPKKKKTKKVTFSGEVEIFPSSSNTTTTKRQQKTKSADNDNLVRGKRFTPEEDEIVKQAVENYIISNNLGDDGLKMILNCKSHKGMKRCWQEIGNCIPYRPHTAIYHRAHILFEQSEHRQWTPEEIKFLKESYKKHGNKWKMIAEELGKHRFHVKDTWRRIVKLENLKIGKWSQDEYQNLYDMVNLDLQMKITGQEKKSKHGMLRDNIPWTSISEKLTTRSDSTCCRKWYEQLTSSLVAEKKWSDADDYWLVGKLYEIDAACVEDVEWDELLEHRSGEICRKRWDQMVVCIGNHKSKTFGEQVEILAKRYRPELAETRQIWDDKPLVP